MLKYVPAMLPVLALALSWPAVLHAQEPSCPQLSAISIDSAAAAVMKPDVVIRASASAASLTFNGQPRSSVTFRGCGLRDTVHVLERTNLPKTVVSGVTYRNVRIAVEILAFLDPECILAQLTSPPGAARDTTGAITAPGCRRSP